MKSIIIASLVVFAIAVSPGFDRPFCPKSEYVYKFDGLLLSGIPTTSAGASQTRISCSIRLQAIDDRNIHIQVIDVEFSSSHLPQTEQWPRMESLEKREISDEFKAILELPFRAQFDNGLISEVQFSNEDAEWSMNIKRGFANLFSLQKSAPVDEMSEIEKDREIQKDTLFFTVNEKTIEGNCEVAYTIVQDGQKTIYTKSINFEKCITRPETSYGVRFGFDCKQCEGKGTFVRPQTVYTYTFENERLEQSEVHSLYTLIVNGQEVIRSETLSKIVFVKENEINREVEKVDGRKKDITQTMETEKLLWDFCQKGDKADVNPFAVVPTKTKVDQLRNIFNQIQESDQNTPETVHLMSRAIRFLRMSTIDELRQIHSGIYMKSNIKVQNIIENTMAVAGSRNTIHHLIHHIKMNTIAPLRAAELLKSIQRTIFPTEEIADILIELARSPLAGKNEPLRQSAWLAAGSVVRGFGSKTQDLPLARPPTRQLKEKYVRVFMQLFRNSETAYEKVLALKTLGNAGIDLSVYELVELIQDPRQPLSILTEAVDALRLLKDVMPRKIQKVLLPVYKNRQNKPELRMSALWRMMHTLPEEPVLAHIVAQMEQESNQHVAAFTYNVIRQFARSTNPCYSPLAVRCSKVLLFTRYQPQEQILSTYAQLPLFNSEMLSGVQFDFATIFEKNAYLPKEIQASMESVTGGYWNKYFAQVGFSQQNFEQVILKALEKLSAYGKQSDELRSTRVQSGIQMLQEIVKKMNIRPRVQKTESKNAHAVFYLRYKEMDYIVLPLDMETLDTLLEKYVREGELDIKSVLSFLNKDSKFEIHRAFFFYEAVGRVPTSIGVPLSVTDKMPTMLSFNGKFSFKVQNMKVHLSVNVLPSIAITHISEMIFWNPLFSQGTKSLQSTQIHTPLVFESVLELKSNSIEISHKFIVPENEKTSVALNTRPVSFFRMENNTVYSEAEEITISNSQYQFATEEIDRQYEVVGLTINAQGNVLSQWSLPKALMTEQDFEYTLENKNSPAEFSARLTIGNLEKTDLSEIKFDKILKKEFDLENKESESRREYFHKMIRQIQSEQGLKNTISLKLEAPQNMFWTSEVRTTCDQSVRMCRVQMDCRRSPIYREQKEWLLTSELLVARPQMPSSLRQLREQPHREVQLALNTKWGVESSKKSEITINAQLEQSKEQEKWVRNMEREFNGIPEYELLIKASRLNQINAVAEYKLTQEDELTFSRFFDLIKAYNFWTVFEKTVENEELRAVFQLTVEPLTRQYVNMTIQTPQQQIQLKNVHIPLGFLSSFVSLTNQECEVGIDGDFEKENNSNKWSRKGKREESLNENTGNKDETENKSVEKTLIKEFSHRVCFSLEPVAECRRGYESEKTSSKKIRFTCMPRHSKNARRFLKESREQGVLDLADFPVSFVETVKISTVCTAL